ncbi:MAG: hypothetical protein KAS12_01685 [Candidatus Aenigmarchaeota archaeon]|nr:hypothetical protein [Candidatus Aenigmarchaeota archaeon]
MIFFKRNMKIFNYAVPQRNNETKSSIIDAYSREDILSKFIIRDEHLRNFKVFSSVERYRIFFESTIKENRCFHEVSFGFQPQKLKFDIDGGNIPKDDNLVKLALTNCIDAIKEIFYRFYHIYLFDLSDDDIICTTSSGAESDDMATYKHSFHIIINNFCVDNYLEAECFTAAVIEEMEIKYIPFIDAGVNKSVQNFRILHCTKSGSKRIKRPIHDDQFIELTDTLITQITNCRMLPKMLLEAQVRENRVDPNIEINIDHILAKAAKYLVGQEVREVKDGLILFNRLEPTFCQICERVHKKDNTVYICITGGNIYLKCRRNKTKSILVDNENDIPVEEKMTMKGYIETIKILPKEGTHFDDLMNKIIYDEPKLRKFDLVKTLYIDAQMKMGKTKALIQFCREHFVEKSVIIVSFRQTFSNSVKERFGNFTLYNKINGNIDLEVYRKLIIQVESLHRLIIPQIGRVDLLIFDESESIFEQLGSGLLSNFSESFAVFQWLIKFSEHFIAMDANISNRTFNIVNHMRHNDLEPQFNPDSQYHCNKMSTADEDNYRFTFSLGVWLDHLTQSIYAGDKIVIPINSINEAEVLREFIKKKFPQKNVKLYSSKTQPSEKQLHFSNVDKYWSEYDILIYTPTISAGISFEQEHFSTIMGYFIETSCGVEVCRQMIGRIRNVGLKKFLIYLSHRQNHLPTEPEKILKIITDRRNNLYRKITDKYLTLEFNANNQIEIRKTDYLQIFLENTRIKNLSINNFAKRFIFQIYQSGANVDGLKMTTNTEIIQEMIEGHKTASEEIIAIRNREISHAEDANEEIIFHIQELKNTQADITLEESTILERYNLRDFYSYTGEIDEAFVDTYYPKSTREKYQNLKIVDSFKTDIKESLQNLQNREKSFFSYQQENPSIQAQFRDLTKRYKFDKHRIGLGILQICGIENVNTSLGVYKSANAILKEFQKAKLPIHIIEQEFNCTVPNIGVASWKKMETFINKVISMYGLKFIPIPRRITELEVVILQKENIFGQENQPTL